MQIACHIGANCTDEDRLMKSLLKNAPGLAAEGIKVPGPGKYRRLLRETIQALNGQTPAPETREILLDAFVDEEECNRLVLSNDEFMCIHRRIFDSGQFYMLGDEKFIGMRQIFAQDELEIFLGIRNPATWLPEVFRAIKDENFTEFMQGVAPESIRWSDLIARIQALLPGVPVTVWCNEDTPLIWAQIIREVAGIDPLTRINGGFDLLRHIMSDEGMKRFAAYLRAHPPQTEVQKRRIISAFLEKYALDDVIEEEIDLPGWTDQTVHMLSDLYEEDCERIARMPGVTFITP